MASNQRCGFARRRGRAESLLPRITVFGVDCSAQCFAFVGDMEDTTTWKLPLFIPGDEAKTINHIKSALNRVAQVKGIDDAQRESVRLLILGAAIGHGMVVDRASFFSKSDRPAEKKSAPTPAKATEILKDPEVE